MHMSLKLDQTSNYCPRNLHTSNLLGLLLQSLAQLLYNLGPYWKTERNSKYNDVKYHTNQTNIQQFKILIYLLFILIHV